MANDPVERPSVATALGWLAIAWGSIGLLAMLYGARSLTSLGQLNSFQQAVAASVLLIVLLPLVAGIGVLKGTPWGWWILGFHSVMGIFRNAQACIFLLLRGEIAKPPAYNLEMACVRLVVFLALLAYWRSNDLRRWCKVETVSRRSALGFVCGAAALTVAAFTLWQWYGR